MTVPGSIARQALALSRVAAAATPRPYRTLGYLDGDRWVAIAWYRNPDGTPRVERSETRTRRGIAAAPALNPHPVCEDCGRGPMPGLPPTYCACGGRITTTPAPAGAAR